MKKKLFLPLLMGLILLDLSCKKQDAIKPSVNLPSITGSFPTSPGGIPSYPLSWETISFMPTPPGVTPIPVPWQSGLGGSKIDDDILFDYAQADGWELVYNTFNTTTVLTPSYFMLYNKYRGVLRTYFYFAPGQNYPSNNIVSQLSMNVATSPVLNFSGTDLIDFGTNQQAVTQLQPFQVSSTGSWYASEFELAYDSSTAITPYPNTTMEWQINPNSIANISLNGTQTGTLNGTIAVPAAKTNFFAGLTSGIVNAAVNVGTGYATKLLSFLKPDRQASVASAANSGISGTINGFLSGVFGFTQSSTSNEKVSLTLNTDISVSGTSTVSSQLYDNIFAIPGTLNNNQAVPFYPAYNQPMGVFYIDAKPQVNATLTTATVTLPVPPPGEPDPWGGRKTGTQTNRTYTVNSSSFNMIFNPAVLSVATISNIKFEVLVFGIDPLSSVPNLSFSGQTEDILGYGGVGTGTSFIIGMLALHEQDPPAASSVGVRISFDVIPNNGSPKQTIVKSFTANLINH